MNMPMETLAVSSILGWGGGFQTYLCRTPYGRSWCLKVGLSAHISQTVASDLTATPNLLTPARPPSVNKFSSGLRDKETPSLTVLASFPFFFLLCWRWLMDLLHHWLVSCLPAHSSVKTKGMKRSFFSLFSWVKTVLFFPFSLVETKLTSLIIFMHRS